MSVCYGTSIADVVGAIVGRSMRTGGVVMMASIVFFTGTCFSMTLRARQETTESGARWGFPSLGSYPMRGHARCCADS
jgi:hypothetical protein